jgi:hypothetical protein
MAAAAPGQRPGLGGNDFWLFDGHLLLINRPEVVG